jgi:hypothetical protein
MIPEREENFSTALLEIVQKNGDIENNLSQVYYKSQTSCNLG